MKTIKQHSTLTKPANVKYHTTMGIEPSHQPSQDKMSSSQPQTNEIQALTFGTEIEFSLAVLEEGAEDPDRGDGRMASGFSTAYVAPLTGAAVRNVEEHIVNTIEKAGFPAMLDSGGMGSPSEIERSQKWFVTNDYSIECPREAHGSYTWYPIEINSPVYYFDPESVAAVQRVCSVLSATYRVSCNQSCGLHVHVGREAEGFSDTTVRNLIATLWTFEDRFNQIHPSHRISQGNQYCAGFHDSFLARPHNGKPITQMRVDGLEDLLGIQTRNQLIESMKSVHSTRLWETRLGYHFINLAIPFKFDLKRTVEYRQHESTLDPEAVGHWLHLCAGLVDFAEKMQPQVLEPFLRENVGKSLEECDLVRVLMEVGLPAQADYYGGRLEMQNQRQRAAAVAAAAAGQPNGNDEGASQRPSTKIIGMQSSITDFTNTFEENFMRE